MLKGILIGIVIGGLGVFYLTRPNDTPPPPLRPVVAETTYVDRPGPPEIEYRDRWLPQDTAYVPTPYEVVVFKPVAVACAEATARRRIVSAVFGEMVGDTARILSEVMTGAGDTLNFQLIEEGIYTEGFPKRVFATMNGTTFDWIDFPVEHHSSCSIFHDAKVAGYTIGLFKLAEAIFDLGATQ